MRRKKGKRNTPQAIMTEIVKRHEAGESAPALSKEYEMPLQTVKNIIYRERRKQKELILIGRLPRDRGRKPAVTLAEYKYENARLKMENQLLRDFLQWIERM
jgi:hypothetical protein